MEGLRRRTGEQTVSSHGESRRESGEQTVSPHGEDGCRRSGRQQSSSISLEDIMMKLTELYENQNRVPQKPPPESSIPRPPIDSTVEEETIRSLLSLPTGRRRLVLG